MSKPKYFESQQAFESWLKSNHNTAEGMDIYLFKKGYEEEGITYEEAVRTALCYGWIDAVTHSCDEKKFIQYFAPRLKTSKWSLSNKIRVRDLINNGQMTEHGLKFFDLTWLDSLDELIEAERLSKQLPVEIPESVRDELSRYEALESFKKETKSVQKRYIAYILDAKKDETKLRRCKKIAGIVKGEIANNL